MKTITPRSPFNIKKLILDRVMCDLFGGKMKSNIDIRIINSFRFNYKDIFQFEKNYLQKGKHVDLRILYQTSSFCLNFLNCDTNSISCELKRLKDNNAWTITSSIQVLLKFDSIKVVKS